MIVHTSISLTRAAIAINYCNRCTWYNKWHNAIKFDIEVSNYPLPPFGMHIEVIVSKSSPRQRRNTQFISKTGYFVYF